MAFGDPANAGANHGNHDFGTMVAGTAQTITAGFATTNGNTLVVGVRRGTGTSAGTTTVAISEDGGATFNAATQYGSAHLISSGGYIVLKFFQLSGSSGNVQIQYTSDQAISFRTVYCEYVGAFATNGAEIFTDNGLVAPATGWDSGAMTTSVTSTLIGYVGWGHNGNALTSAATGGTTNSLTWTIRDILSTGNPLAYQCALTDFNGGGQAAGTYHNLGHWTASANDNVGAAIYSFVAAGGGGGAAAPAVPVPRLMTQGVGRQDLKRRRLGDLWLPERFVR